MSDILGRISLKRLHDLAESFDIVCGEETERSHLERLIAAELVDENYVIYHGIYTGEQGLNFLEAAARGELIPYDRTDCVELMPLMVGGLLYPFRVGEDVVFTMPREIAKIVFEMERDELFWEDREQEQDFHQLFRAAVHLYGIIPLAELVDLYNSYAFPDEETDVVEISDMIDAFTGYNLCEYVMRGKNLCSVRAELGEEEKRRILRRRQGIPPYVPRTRAELDRFANSGYYQTTPAHERVWRFLREEVGLTGTHADSLLDLLDRFLQSVREPERMMERMREERVSLPGKEEAARLRVLLTELRQNTRLWELCGHMETERTDSWLVEDLESKVISLKTRKVIGGDDPCPCGSGKKFAECCGKKTD